jgi:hypothetical protein
MSAGEITPDLYDRLNRSLDFIHGFASAVLRGEWADAELTNPAIARMVAELPMTLDLPDGYGQAELDQRVADLRAALLGGSDDG